MKPFIILSFIAANGRVLTRKSNGQNTGFYAVADNALCPHRRKLEDFTCAANTSIQSVLRCEGNQRAGEGLPNGTVFTLADRLSDNTFIEAFDIRRGIVRVQNTDGDIITLDNVRKWEEPVAAPIPEPVREQPRPVVEPVRQPEPAPQANVEVIRPMNLQQIAAKVNEMVPRPIRLANTLRNRRNETLAQFLLKFFTDYNLNKATIYADRPVRNPEVQTEPGKNRSFADIFKICQYYYPNCTVKDVFKALHTELPRIMPNGFRSSYCKIINKRVWYFNPAKGPTAVNDLARVDEFGNIYNRYADQLLREAAAV